MQQWYVAKRCKNSMSSNTSINVVVNLVNVVRKWWRRGDEVHKMSEYSRAEMDRKSASLCYPCPDAMILERRACSKSTFWKVIDNLKLTNRIVSRTCLYYSLYGIVMVGRILITPHTRAYPKMHHKSLMRLSLCELGHNLLLFITFYWRNGLLNCWLKWSIHILH